MKVYVLNRIFVSYCDTLSGNIESNNNSVFSSLEKAKDEMTKLYNQELLDEEEYGVEKDESYISDMEAVVVYDDGAYIAYKIEECELN